MRVHFDDYKCVIISGPKTIRFNLTNKVNNNLNHEIDQIVKHNECLAEQRIKT